MNQGEPINLLTEREPRGLFPDTTIHKERVFGLTKSLIAVRGKSLPTAASPRSPPGHDPLNGILGRDCSLPGEARIARLLQSTSGRFDQAELTQGL